MNTQELLTAIKSRTATRFEIYIEESWNVNIQTYPFLNDTLALRLRRCGSKSGWRTILAASIESSSSLKQALMWASEVRDRMVEPETADLYLILVGTGLSKGEATRLEADELFCKKYAYRHGETVTDLLDRCFLAEMPEEGRIDVTNDPLTAAFRAAAEKYPELTPSVQQDWRNAFLEGLAGTDLVEKLMNIPFEGSTEK
ncbi:ABC-three component system middle component 1 [Azohydromonas lata]|uniref:ABC-three component system middle component 1 n=1 Tax=Azohydromonas lata TaxID=45677 RepID=UPI0012F4D46A|nr:ABC-three component system middle component 1 [Azohydromonas lata]